MTKGLGKALAGGAGGKKGKAGLSSDPSDGTGKKTYRQGLKKGMIRKNSQAC